MLCSERRCRVLCYLFNTNSGLDRARRKAAGEDERVSGACSICGNAGTVVQTDLACVSVGADAKGYTRGFEQSIGYKKGYAAGEKLAREQAANMNAAAAK